MVGEQLPDPRNPWNVACNPKQDSIMTFTNEMGSGIKLEQLQQSDLPVIKTASVQASMASFASWLAENNRQPFLIVGPEGCGKG